MMVIKLMVIIILVGVKMCDIGNSYVLQITLKLMIVVMVMIMMVMTYNV